MDPDPYWIQIQIGIQPKMLDPDPDEMNAERIRNPAVKHLNSELKELLSLPPLSLAATG